MGFPELGKVGLYAIQTQPGLVKFGRTETCLTQRIIHHIRNMAGLGMAAPPFAWVEHPWPRKAERDLKRRLKRSGFEQGATLESYYIGWDVAKRMLAAVADREFE